MKKHPAAILWPDSRNPNGDSIAEQSGPGSKKKQEQIIREHLDVSEFVDTVRYALDPFKLFYLTVVPGLQEIHSAARKAATRKVDLFDESPKKLSWSDQFKTMFELLDNLATRKLPPNSTQARQACLQWARCCGPGTIAVFKSILKKDLKCHVGAATFNKIKPEWIPQFLLSLARPFNPDKLTFPCFVDPKFDGERCLAQISFDGNNEGAFYMSRYGNPLYNYGCFTPDLLKIFRDVGNCIVDCEGISKLGFQHRMRTPKWEDPNFDTSHFQLIVFDLIPQDAWDAQSYDMNQRSRFEELTKLFRGFISDKVLLVETRLVRNQQELESVYAEWIAKGLEGVICKQPEGDYHFSTTSKRNPGWMKIKGKESDEFEIVGIELGNTGRRWEGKCGSLLISKKDKSGENITVGVASGLTHYHHENIIETGDQILYKQPDGEIIDIKGKLVEVIYDCETEDGSLRFPRIKPTEKIIRELAKSMTPPTRGGVS